MSGKRAWLTLFFLAAGAAASYSAAKAYRAAKATCPPFRKRTYSDSRALVQDFADFWKNPEILRSLRANPRLTQRLTTQMMLAVTGANGCRSCAVAQTRLAIQRGLTRAEIDSLLDGRVEHVAAEDAPAVYLARHYAEREGKPEPDLVAQLVQQYGEATARDMLHFLRLAQMVNLVGNTADALISRALGKPSPTTTLKDELAIVSVFGFGVVPLLAAAVVRAYLPVPAVDQAEGA